MSKYLVVTSRDVIKYTSYIVEAEENWEDGEYSDEWYEPSGDTCVVESEEITD